jgi:hypothetical protein
MSNVPKSKEQQKQPFTFGDGSEDRMIEEERQRFK